MSGFRSRRAELQQRCQHERNEFIVSVSATVAQLPRARQIARWMRFARRLLRDIRT
jgi:hypothetical protein